jgi:hypothetical protein
MSWRGPANKSIPNQVPNPVNQGNEMSGTLRTDDAVAFPFKEKRGLDVRRDKDAVMDFSVKLLDVDTTILSYLDTVISPTVVDAGRQVKVPIIYASPERWQAIRKDGVIRDKQGKVQCPVIAFRRSTMQRNDTLITMNRYLQYPVIKRFSEKNKYDKFSVMSGFAPVKEAYAVTLPDHVIVNYEFIVWTAGVEQGNHVVEGINFSTEDYWGTKERFKFRTSISDYNFETTVDAGQDRIVKTTFSLMVYAYLLPNRYENYKSTVQKAFTKRKVVINFDAVVSDTLQPPSKQSLELYSVSTKNSQGGSGFTESPSGNGPPFPGIAESANHAFVADFAGFSTTSSYFNSSGSITVGSLNIQGSNGATASFASNTVYNVSGSEYVDSIPISSGNAGRWLISVNDGGSNFKTVEIVATWNTANLNYYVTEVSQLGSVPVVMSADNSGGNINISANPLSGTWTIKFMRTVV